MKRNIINSLVSALALTSLASIVHATVVAPYIELGAAGPQNWAVLDAGNFSLADPSGYINGNVGEVSGNGTTGGSAGVEGNVYLGSGATFGGPVSGTTYNNSGLPSTALSLANAAATYYNGLAANFTTAPSAGTVTPGVYDITGDWSPQGGTYNLTAGQIYVFNISGNFKPSANLFINDPTPYDVIFNVSGNAGNVQSSGGASTYPSMDGIFLAQGSISLTAGWVTGELISYKSINIASSGSVNDTFSVPDAGSSLLLMSLGLGFLALAKKKLIS